MNDKDVVILEEIALGEYDEFYGDSGKLTQKQRAVYCAGFIAALAWMAYNNHVDMDSFKLSPEDFQENPEEQAEFYRTRYEGLDTEQRAALEESDRIEEETWGECVRIFIKQNRAVYNFMVGFMSEGLD